MSHLNVVQEGEVVVVKINRPHALNALNRETLEELLAFLEESASKPVRALVLSGEGEKAFIAGADIKEMQTMNHLQMLEFCTLGQKVANALESAPFLTIAAVNGYALGGGLEMALACDFIYASDKAKLGLPEVSLGIIPGFGGTQRLPRAIGTRLAKEMIMSGMILPAERARDIGIVNHVCKAETLLEDSLVTAGKITKNSYTAIIQAKSAINAGYHLGITEALELEKNMCAVCFATEERANKMLEFTERSTKK